MSTSDPAAIALTSSAMAISRVGPDPDSPGVESEVATNRLASLDHLTVTSQDCHGVIGRSWSPESTMIRCAQNGQNTNSASIGAAP